VLIGRDNHVTSRQSQNFVRKHTKRMLIMFTWSASATIQPIEQKPVSSDGSHEDREMRHLTEMFFAQPTF